MSTEELHLTGPERAAAFILAIGEERASKIFENMEEEEIKELSQKMIKMGNVTADMIEKVFVDFVSNISSTGAVLGSMETAERLLQKILPKGRADAIMDDVRGPIGRTVWEKLGNVHEEILAGYLRGEHPQTISVILSRIKAGSKSS